MQGCRVAWGLAMPFSGSPVLTIAPLSSAKLSRTVISQNRKMHSRRPKFVLHGVTVVSSSVRYPFFAFGRCPWASVVFLSPASGLPKDLLPGPYPRTPEERAAAAKKYNLRVEDYEPHPDDGMGFGDYPKLPDRSQHERDPYYKWDHSDLRRNHGEPMHWDFDMFLRTRVDTSPTAIPWHTMRNWMLGFFGFLALMFALGEIYPSYQPVGPKQYPYNNLYLEYGGDPKQQPPEEKNYEI